MKLPILAAVAALALAAVAAAQAQPDTRAGPVYGYETPQPTEPYSYLDRTHHTRPPVNATLAHEASDEFRMACAADRETFCKGRKTSDAVAECIKIRRSKVSSSCRTAWDNLVLASAGRL